MLAEANGLPGARALPAGALINVPLVQRSSNTYATFAPYDPGSRIGDTSLAQIDPPPPPPRSSKRGLGGVGAMLMVVVAMALTVVIARAAAGAVGALVPTLAGTTTAAVTGGAVGAAAGSTASQRVGLGAGPQQSFSWKAVGLAALGGAVSGGINGVLWCAYRRRRR